MIAPDSYNHWLLPVGSVILRQGTLTCPPCCTKSSRFLTSCCASRRLIFTDRRRISWRTLMQKGQVVNWYNTRLPHCWSTCACNTGERTSPSGRESLSRSSITGPSTSRKVLKKVRIKNFIVDTEF